MAQHVEIKDLGLISAVKDNDSFVLNDSSDNIAKRANASQLKQYVKPEIDVVQANLTTHISDSTKHKTTDEQTKINNLPTDTITELSSKASQTDLTNHIADNNKHKTTSEQTKINNLPNDTITELSNKLTPSNLLEGTNITLTKNGNNITINSTATGTVGTTNHAELTNLDYNNSNHTGFASEIDLNSHKDDTTIHITQNEIDSQLSDFVKIEVGNSNNIKFEDGETFQEKYDEGKLNGNDGLNATINGLNVLEIIDSDTVTTEISDGQMKLNAIIPTSSVALMFFGVEDGNPVATHTSPIEEQVILNSGSYISANPGIWHDVRVFALGKDLQGSELEFIPGNLFTAKFWIRSDISRNNAQFRLRATNATTGDSLATGTTSVDLGQTGELQPVIITGIYEMPAVVLSEDIRMTLQVLTPEFGIQIGIFSIPPNEISYISRLISGVSSGGGIEDAPIDGNYWVRHNANWEQIKGIPNSVIQDIINAN